MDDLNSFKIISFAFSKSLHVSLLLVEFNRTRDSTSIFGISKENVFCIILTCDLYEILHSVNFFAFFVIFLVCSPGSSEALVGSMTQIATHRDFQNIVAHFMEFLFK